MVLTLISEPFNIDFHLLEMVKLDSKQNLYKFSLSFTHYENPEIQFSLPTNYRTYLSLSALIRLIRFLTDKINALIEQGGEQDVQLSFDEISFVNAEYDIEVDVNTGEYYPEKDGWLYLVFFFNLNVAYHHVGTSMVGFQARVTLKDLRDFMANLGDLIKI